MDDHVLEYLLEGVNAINAGPNAREIFCLQADEEYKNGNLLHCVFYHVMMLFQTFELRYGQLKPEDDKQQKSVKDIRATFNEFEEKDFQSNKLMQYVYEELLKKEKSKGAIPKFPKKEKPFHFLEDVRTPQKGLRQIQDVCYEMPQEWTIMQLSKGFRPDTTYSVFTKIKEGGAPIYLTILKHVRSTKYPNPICLRFDGPETNKLYENHALIAKRFKAATCIDPNDAKTTSQRQKYWQTLSEIDQFIEVTLKEFRAYFFPWAFLFTGSPVQTAEVLEQMGNAFVAVDGFCNTEKLEAQERVLLSLAALHILTITEAEQEGISKALAANARKKTAIMKFLDKIKLAANAASNKPAPKSKKSTKCYPCILIVDERLDHFFWEELNVQQEFCRVSSLHCLWRLHKHYKHSIKKGYVVLNVENGSCLLNPDTTLKAMEMRMKSFYKYWTPHWLIKCAEKPTSDEIYKDFLQSDCYAYAGHGSGLQYINGKHIARHQFKSVVFLFGCDSALLRSNGLYSELIGAHYYYHAAMCPAVIGCLLPGLDMNMDTIAASVQSRWIAPKSQNVLTWDEIDLRSWKKEGVIKEKMRDPSRPGLSLKDSPNYQAGSLCYLMARVHQRCFDSKFYNTVGYVCRGLPVWNLKVQSL